MSASCHCGSLSVCRQGAESSQDEEGASAILAVQLDDELGGGAVQVLGALGPVLSDTPTH